MPIFHLILLFSPSLIMCPPVLVIASDDGLSMTRYVPELIFIKPPFKTSLDWAKVVKFVIVYRIVPIKICFIKYDVLIVSVSYRIRPFQSASIDFSPFRAVG